MQHHCSIARQAVEEWGAQQKPEELAQLLEQIETLAPSTVVEIGSGEGGSLIAFSRVASKDWAHLVSVDKIVSPRFPDDPITAGYVLGECWRSLILKYNVRDLIRPSHYATLLKGNSHKPRMRARLERRLGGRPIDFLFIDGDHTYEGVRQDYEMYSPLVRTGGLIALHDINPHDPSTGCEVARFWGELKAAVSTREILFEPDTKGPHGPWAGIGLVYKN